MILLSFPQHSSSCLFLSRFVFKQLFSISKGIFSNLSDTSKLISYNLLNWNKTHEFLPLNQVNQRRIPRKCFRRRSGQIRDSRRHSNAAEKHRLSLSLDRPKKVQDKKSMPGKGIIHGSDDAGSSKPQINRNLSLILVANKLGYLSATGCPNGSWPP